LSIIPFKSSSGYSFKLLGFKTELNIQLSEGLPDLIATLRLLVDVGDRVKSFQPIINYYIQLAGAVSRF
jgi:hypothetical protein